MKRANVSTQTRFVRGINNSRDLRAWLEKNPHTDNRPMVRQKLRNLKETTGDKAGKN